MKKVKRSKKVKKSSKSSTECSRRVKRISKEHSNRKPWHKKVSKKELKAKIKEDLSHVNVGKFLGFCKCGSMVSTLEKVGTLKYVCTECKYKGLVSKLSETSIRSREKPESKKEYLQSTFAANFHDMPGYREKLKESIEKPEDHEEVIEEKDEDIIDPVEASMNSTIIPPLVEKYGSKEVIGKKKRGRPRKIK